jgi:hypothetical protein
MKGDNVIPWSEFARDEWARMEATWTAADPLTVPESPTVQLAATRSRDGLLLALAVLVIVALLGYAIGRAS